MRLRFDLHRLIYFGVRGSTGRWRVFAPFIARANKPWDPRITIGQLTRPTQLPVQNTRAGGLTHVSHPHDSEWARYFFGLIITFSFPVTSLLGGFYPLAVIGIFSSLPPVLAFLFYRVMVDNLK